MTDFNSLQVPLDSIVNSTVITPTETEPGNITYLYEKFNNLITTLEQEIELLKSRIRYFENDYNGIINYVIPFSLERDEATSNQKKTISVDRAGTLFWVEAKGITTSNLLGVKVNDVVRPIIETSSTSEFVYYFFQDIDVVNVGDNITVIYNEDVINPIEVNVYVQA